ncbi:MAG: peptidylprolyl isomerase [Arcobacter sp.]|nr:MAG: peptidylprolyl isomerase [Arcobacter sp.]
MITWMQRHKKWLVITIWISTIAFIGAGFVGWGSYDFGSKGGAVAVVGDREVSVSEYQREYSSMYDQYTKIFGEQFNQEIADKLNLKDAAYKMIIQKNLILSFADELGLDVTNEEIAKQLVAIPGFIKDGKFDKETYIKVLRQNRTNPTEFEATLKRDLLLQKIESIFKINANKSELEDLNRLLFSQDDISIDILNSKDITVDIKDEDIKKYWESNKNNYKSQPAVSLEFSEVALVSETFTDEDILYNYEKFRIDYKKEDGKIKTFEEAKEDVIKALNVKATKKEALKKYLKLKKDEEKFENSLILDESKLAYGAENNKKIADTVPGDILKPFLVGDKYIIVKVLNKIAPKELSYEKAKAFALNDYKKVAKSMQLEKNATEALKKFNGTNIGLVSRDSFDKISGLNKEEALSFLNRLFSSTEKQGKITVGDKVVLYKINDAKLATYDNTKEEAVKTTINNLLNQELMTNFVKNLEKRYEVKSSINLEE